MQNTWINIKNSTKGGNRPIEDFQSDVDAGISTFEKETGLVVDGPVREAFGARGYFASSLRQRTYSHPFPHLMSNGGYIFGCLSVPADIEDGKPNFTNLTFIATDKIILSTIGDPHIVYNPSFGGAIVDQYERHQKNPTESASGIVLRFITYRIAAIDHSMDALSNRLQKNRSAFDVIDRREGREVEAETKKRQPIVSILDTEINSLTTVIQQVEIITAKVMNNDLVINDKNGSRSFFSESQRRDSLALYLQAARLHTYHENLRFECKNLLESFSSSRDIALAFATHRITAYGAAILIPNMLYDFFGQSWSGMPIWFSNRGLQLSLALTVIYWTFQFWWFKRKKYL